MATRLVCVKCSSIRAWHDPNSIGHGIIGVTRSQHLRHRYNCLAWRSGACRHYRQLYWSEMWNGNLPRNSIILGSVHFTMSETSLFLTQWIHTMLMWKSILIFWSILFISITPVKLLGFSLSRFCLDTCSFSSSSRRKSRAWSSSEVACPVCLLKWVTNHSSMDNPWF